MQISCSSSESGFHVSCIYTYIYITKHPQVHLCIYIYNCDFAANFNSDYVRLCWHLGTFYLCMCPLLFVSDVCPKGCVFSRCLKQESCTTPVPEVLHLSYIESKARQALGCKSSSSMQCQGVGCIPDRKRPLQPEDGWKLRPGMVLELQAQKEHPFQIRGSR